LTVNYKLGLEVSAAMAKANSCQLDYKLWIGPRTS